MRTRVSAIFFVSGAAALLFEALWFHQAGLTFGNSVWASSLVLAGFMGGLALGGAIAWRRGDRLARPLAVYAWLELAVAVSGVALVFVLPALGSALATALSKLANLPALLNATRLSLALLLLLVPSTAMGMTLPLLARALGGIDTNFGRVLGRLYGYNTLGAVVGVLATELVLLPALGIRVTALVGGALSGGAGALAMLLARGASSPPVAQPSPIPWRAALPLLLAAFGAGFALLGLEVVWLRFLLLFLNGSSLAFATILALVLAGIAVGGLLAALWAARDASADRHAVAVAFAAGVLGIVGYRAFPWFGNRVNIGAEQTATLIAMLAAPLVVMTSLASGALFTLLGVRLRRALGAESAATGSLALANTLGAALGPLVAGFVLLPGIGLEMATFGLLALYGAVAALLLPGARPAVSWVGAGAFAAGLAAFPFGEMSSRYLAASLARWRSSPDDRVLSVRSGSAATVAYLEHRVLGRRRYLQLVTNAFSMSSTQFWARRYGKLYAYWPIAVMPRVKSALVIGYGVGNTLRAFTDSRELATIDLVDISRDILELGQEVSEEPARRALRDPRVAVHVEDGRWFLQGSERRWDVITGEPPPHHIAGVVNLYSLEYFRLLRSRLTQGGVVTYWLHADLMTGKTARGILRAFCDAFGDCSLWHGSGVDFMLVGSNGASGPVSEQRFVAQWREPDVRRELVALGLEKPEQLGALFIADARHLKALVADDEPVVDDRPHLLRGAPRGFVEGLTEPWRDVAAAKARFADSELVTRLWPPALRARTLDWFDEQHLLNQLLFRKPLPGFQKDLATLHQALTSSDLELPVLLLLDTDPDVQRAAEAAARQGERSPHVLRHLAVASLARRDFERAKQELYALENGEYGRTARALLAYLEKHQVPGAEAAPRP